ncbi:DUF1385 domain-containing protein [Bacillus sp. RG28]|uniref:DUF1385 domain-containing protein n=1 Tax=Gottfriedia endophytica TaxID=2820819 RepID=A0A940SJP0_9BACI|nr:DUF1385 domain-containing protein [Gottfriedia endophytica]MBP0724428.1 DUF1385 domain-containing protein [Gottfriedia endophytica]
MREKKKAVYGGQAIVEGVMFGGRKHAVSAIRRNNGEIEYYKEPLQTNATLQKLKKIPFVRGIVAIIQASINGSKHLNFSSERYEVSPEDDEKIAIEKANQKNTIATYLGISVLAVLSFLIGKVIFTLVPVLLATTLKSFFSTDFEQVIVESLIKLLLLLTYIYLVSLTPFIKRVFQYHGAEHKVINAFENNLPLTVENVQSQSRLHYRCGSSFILFTVVVGMFIYFLVPTNPLWLRIIDRLLLIPVVLGIAFEVLQFTNLLRNIPVLKWLGYLGLWLQLLTTKEPSNDQVEVSIASFNYLLSLEKNHDEKILEFLKNNQLQS